jgi:hypothetical protein
LRTPEFGLKFKSQDSENVEWFIEADGRFPASRLPTKRTDVPDSVATSVWFSPRQRRRDLMSLARVPTSGYPYQIQHDHAEF